MSESFFPSPLAGIYAPIAKAPFSYAFKTADQVKASDTTLAGDTALSLTLASGKSYLIRFVAFVRIGNATMGLQYDATFTTATGTHETAVYRHQIASAAGTDNETTAITDAAATGTVTITGVAGVARVEIEALVACTGTGLFRFRWAQNTSDAGSLTVLKGSYAEYMEIA